MSNRNSLNGRLSLSTSNLSGPIAESTQIGGLQQKFPWGGIHSPGKSVENINHSKIINHNTKRSNFNNSLQKLDPRIYTDVQSQGLTSRIVKYYENSMKLNRSSSFNNLYNKPGQFPVVHLKKNEIPYKMSRNRNNVSIVRIAPPDKSVFQANSRSSILRTGSMIPTISLGLKQSENDISRENRPILHPAVENETAPTRSVLEALKEISRKRINSDELDCNESIKKYCKEPNNEISCNLTGPLASLTTQQNSLSSNNTYNKNATKRHRELTSPSVSPTAKIPNNRQNNNNNIKPRKINNEFTSSISSSLSLLTPKRKYSEQNSSRTSTPVSSEISPFSSQPKQKQRCDIVHNINTNNYLKHADNVMQSTGVTSTLSVGATMNTYKSIKTVEPLRTVSEPIIKSNSYLLEPSNQKPKLTLFNKKYEVSEASNIVSGQSDDDSEEVPKISFIKPKSDQANNGINFIKNAMIEKTQKTKLALMLSGLRGDLNEDQDEIDSNIKNIKLEIDENSKKGEEKTKTYFMNPNINTEKPVVNANSLVKNNTEIVNSDSDKQQINKSEPNKQIGGFKFPLEQQNAISPILSNQKEKSSDTTKSSTFNLHTNKNEFDTQPQNSKVSTTLIFNPITTQNSATNFDKGNSQNTETTALADKNKQSVFPTVSTNSSISSISVPMGLKSFNTTNPVSIQTSLKDQKDSNLLNPQTSSNPKIGIDSNFGIEKQNNQPDAKCSGNFLMNPISDNSNKMNNDTSEQMNNGNQQSINVSKSGGFAFPNKLSTFENNSNLLQFSKTTKEKETNSLSTSINAPTQSTKTDFSFGTTNKIQISSDNKQTSEILNQPKTTFTFGNNANKDNSKIFTSQQAGQTNSGFQFTGSINKPAPVFAFGNATSTENNNETNSNKVANSTSVINFNSKPQNNQGANNHSTNTFTPKELNKSENTFDTNSTINNQNTLFQFGGTKNSQQNTFTFKSQDSSKEKTSSVFGSNSFNPPVTNVTNNTFLFGGNAVTSPTKNLFGNTTPNVEGTQIAENKAPTIFATTSDTSLQKSNSTFNFHNTSGNNANMNSNTNLNSNNNVFSFGNPNTQNNQLNSNNNSNANFTFGSNNNSSSHTFGNSKTDNKSNTFGSVTSNTFGNAASNATTNIFGSNVSNSNLNSFNSNAQNSTSNTLNGNFHNTNSFNASPPNAISNTFGNNQTNSFKTNDSSSRNTNVFGNNNPINSAPEQFTFCQTSNNVNNNTINKNNAAFTFNGSNNIPIASTSNVFSFSSNNSTSGSVVDNKPATFNFSGNMSSNNIFGATNNNNVNPTNLFNPGPPDRPFRKATRRLNK